MNYNQIKKDFKTMSKDTQKLVDKYNQTCKSIKNQELEIDKLKSKLEDLTSMKETPASVLQMKKDLKESTQEVEKFEKEYKSLIEQKDNLKFELQMTQGANFNDHQSYKDEELKIQNKINELDNEIPNIANKLELAKNKSSELKQKLNEVKLNPESTVEAQELINKLDIGNTELQETKDKANEMGEAIKNSMKQNHFKTFGGEISQVGEKIDKFKNKISRLIGTAMVFSLLRNQLTSLRNNFISLLKTDDQFSSSLNQVKANLMTAFAPIYNACLPAINSLMNVLSQATGTIAKFVSSLFGTSIKDATKDAKKLSSSLDKTGSSAKKASGALASFDTLEVLPDDESSDGSSGGTGANSIDYSGEISYSQSLLDFMNKIKEFIVENKDYVTSFIWGIVAGVLALKLGLKGITSLGIGVTIAGIILLIKSVINYLNDPSWENFGKIITSIGLIIAGVAILFGAWPVAIAGAIVAIIGLIVSNWEKIKGLGLKAIQWIENHIDEIGDKFGNVGRYIAGIIQGIIQSAINQFEDFFGGIKKIVDGIIKIFKGDFKGGLTSIFSGLKSILLAPINSLIDGVNALINGLNKIKFDVPSWVPVIGGKKLGFNIPKIPRLATGAVIPPRQEFMAILGDQKHGTNIEAPLDTIKQANREVLSEFLGSVGVNGQDREIVLKNWQFILQLGTNNSFAKFIIDEVKKYEKETNAQFLLS